MVLTGPALQAAGQTRFQQARRFYKLFAGIADAAAQVAQLQAALQGELPGHHRRLADTGQPPDALDQVRRVLGGNLRQQVGFQPWRQGQAIVHGDLFAQRLQGTQGVSESIITVGPPAHAAEAF
ncbi:hypothetical protein D3C73_949390 [compost metagenome]